MNLPAPASQASLPPYPACFFIPASCPPSQLMHGRFMLDGAPVVLPGVKESDPLGVKVEALRMFLEDALGTDTFLKCVCVCVCVCVFVFVGGRGDRGRGDGSCMHTLFNLLIDPPSFSAPCPPPFILRAGPL
jgi:hypothetical protein